jgi:hypothetical protein
MKKKMTTLALAIILCATTPIASFSLDFWTCPQAVEIYSEGWGGGVHGSISFAGGNSPLVVDLSGDGYGDYYLMAWDSPSQRRIPTRYSDYICDNAAILCNLDTHFETGPRIGPGYDFRGGSFDFGLVDGFLGDIHVDDTGLYASIYGAHTHESCLASEYGDPLSGYLKLWFTLPSDAPDPFTITNIQRMSLVVAPAPGTLVLLGSGLLGLAGWRRFRKV